MKALKILVFLLLSGFITSLACAQIDLKLVDPLEAIYPDKNDLNRYSARWRGLYPTGSFAEVHVVIEALTDQAFDFTATINGDELPLNYWSELVEVPVEQNTGLDSRTEVFKFQINPHVIRRAPFKVFEVIKPVKSNRIESSTPFTALKLSIPTSDYKPGKHTVYITISGSGKNMGGEFTFEIMDVMVPPLSDARFFYTNWYSLTRMEEKHNVERWTDPWYNMLRKYAALMAHGRQNSILIPGELISLEDSAITLDDDKMLKFIEVFRNVGFKYFESPHLMYRGDNDDWGDPELKVVLTKRRYYKENGKEDIKVIMELVSKFATENNLTDGWLQHIADEPTEIQAACYRDIADQVKSIFPTARIMEATNDRDSIVGAIDLWCPLINDFQENEEFFREREANGEKVLVYTCLVPGGKWLNRTLDQERLRQVYFGWGAAHFNTFGYLHWGLNQYHADPYEQSVVHHPSPIASANNFLPAGDTHVVFPGEDGPLSSVRFESHRVGIEDYELLMMLMDNDPETATKLINKLFASYTEYTTSIKKYRRVKSKVLKSLL